MIVELGEYRVDVEAKEGDNHIVHAGQTSLDNMTFIKTAGGGESDWCIIDNEGDVLGAVSESNAWKHMLPAINYYFANRAPHCAEMIAVGYIYGLYLQNEIGVL